MARKLPATAAFRALNADYTATQATLEAKTAVLKIFGGSFEMDRVLKQAEGKFNNMAYQFEEKIAAAVSLFHYTLINGNSATNVNEFDGLDKMLAGTTSEFNAGAGKTIDLSNIGNLYGVCGLMGNIQSESGLRSINMQNSYEARLGMNDEQYTAAVDSDTYVSFCSDRVGYGLCQWTSAGRKTGLLNYAKSTKRSIGDEDMQIEWLLHELNTAYKAVMKVLKEAKTVKEASDIVVTKFERPANQSPSNLATDYIIHDSK